MAQQELNRDYFNIDLLIPNDKTFQEQGLQPITSLAIFESSSDTFNKDGLFSNAIFGTVGSVQRMSRPSYVDLKLKILHPLVYKQITTVNRLYKDIMAGKTYAVFREDKGVFELPNEDEVGNTGYHFFISHLDKLKYERNESSKRDNRIDLIEKYGRVNDLFRTWLIIPAGLRDYTVDKNGKPNEDEINDKYRTLIGLSLRLANVNITNDNIDVYDPIRYNMQLTVLDIFTYIKTLIDGKHKFIQSKWSGRAITNATANVITGLPAYIKDLNSEHKISANHTVVGLFQYLKALGSITYNRVTSMFFSKVFSTDTNKAMLIDPKTLTSDLVTLDNKTIDKFTSLKGVNDLVNKINQDVIKDTPVTIKGYYLALIYQEGNNIEVILDTRDYDNDKLKLCRPLTYAEMFYISVADIVKHFPCLVTRYPITGYGSIYPSYPYLKTTVPAQHVTCKIGFLELELPEYPIPKQHYFRSMSPHETHLARMGADRDGDTCSFTLLYAKESIEEINKLLASKENYVSTTGKLNYSVSTNTLDIVMLTLTE